MRNLFQILGGGGNFFLWFQIKSLTANLGLAGGLFDDGIVIMPYGVLTLTKNYLRDRTDCITAIRRVFGLSDDAPVQYHALTRAPVRSIPGFESACDRIVVLNPYSNSAELSAAGEAFFEETCGLLKSRGYTVYTNTIKDQKPVAGSLALCCSLEEMLGIAERIPLVVSLRSGFLDLLVPTGVNMFVIYNKQWHYIWYNMKGWNCPGKVREIYYEEKPGDERILMTQFIPFLDELGM